MNFLYVVYRANTMLPEAARATKTQCLEDFGELQDGYRVDKIFYCTKGQNQQIDKELKSVRSLQITNKDLDSKNRELRILNEKLEEELSNIKSDRSLDAYLKMLEFTIRNCSDWQVNGEKINNHKGFSDLANLFMKHGLTIGAIKEVYG